MNPTVIDLYCKAGGSSKGFHDAGFDVVGVDIEPQPRYPYEFHQGDAIEFILKYGKDFDLVYGGPPCQSYSEMTNATGTQDNHPRLVSATRAAMRSTGKPYVIENVPGAPLQNPITLCGSMFNLRVRRHRLFECDPVIWWPPSACNHTLKAPRSGRAPTEEQFFSVVGHFSDVSGARRAMEIDWMTRDELSQAIPPAYTEWLGRQIIKRVLIK